MTDEEVLAKVDEVMHPVVELLESLVDHKFAACGRVVATALSTQMSDGQMMTEAMGAAAVTCLTSLQLLGMTMLLDTGMDMKTAAHNSEAFVAGMMMEMGAARLKSYEKGDE